MAVPRTLVLVVEDELLVREDALDLLRRAGLDARGFGSAMDTLAFLRDHAQETAAVFTDMWLENATEGLDLAATINATWPWISLLVTSGATARPPTGLPLKAHYVTKPWRPEQVLRFIQKQVRPQRSRSEAASSLAHDHLPRSLAMIIGHDHLAWGVQTTESLST